MADVFTKKKRSEVMSRIRSSGTKIEDRLYFMTRTVLPKERRIYRNAAGLPGRPDILIPALRIAIFADGCFFHVCPRHGRIPGSNTDYWAAKLERNQQRDASARRKLRGMGYRTWRFWEHDLKPDSLSTSTVRLKRQLDSAHEI